MAQQGLGLNYSTPNHLGMAQNFYSQAGGSYGSMQKKGPEPPGKTAAGAVGSAASTASAGAMVGSYAAGGSAGGPWGAVIGAAVGLGAYLMS